MKIKIKMKKAKLKVAIISCGKKPPSFSWPVRCMLFMWPFVLLKNFKSQKK